MNEAEATRVVTAAYTDSILQIEALLKEQPLSVSDQLHLFYGVMTVLILLHDEPDAWDVIRDALQDHPKGAELMAHAKRADEKVRALIAAGISR